MSQPDTPEPAPSAVTKMLDEPKESRLLDLAIRLHRNVEGEYGCNGATCPGVQRLMEHLRPLVGVGKASWLAVAAALPVGSQCIYCGGIWADCDCMHPGEHGESRLGSDYADSQSRKASALPVSPQEERPPCSGCGGPHPFDTVLPSEVWNETIRAAGLPDFLCWTCIVAVFARKGVSFNCELWGETFDGLPVAVHFNSRRARHSQMLVQSNTELRHRLSEAERACKQFKEAAHAAAVPPPQAWYPCKCGAEHSTPECPFAAVPPPPREEPTVEQIKNQLFTPEVVRTFLLGTYLELKRRSENEDFKRGVQAYHDAAVQRFPSVLHRRELAAAALPETPKEVSMTECLNQYEAVEQRSEPGVWSAEAIDSKSGYCYKVNFYGLGSEKLAREYVNWKNLLVERGRDQQQRIEEFAYLWAKRAHGEIIRSYGIGGAHDHWEHFNVCPSADCVMARGLKPEVGWPTPPVVERGRDEELLARVRNYLGNGGFFNPEAMDHQKVQRLILDIAAALRSQKEPK